MKPDTPAFYPHCYDRYASLKPPAWFYLALAVLLRPWLVAVAALASRQMGSDILFLFYPDWPALGQALAVSLPAMVLFVIASRRRPQAGRLVRFLWRQGWWLFLLAVAVDGWMLAGRIARAHGLFHWPLALEMCALGLITLMLLTSRQLKQAFREFPEKGD